MTHLKMLGIVAVAVLGLMAFVGAGTASATTIATDAAGTIKYGVGTTVHKTLKTGTSATLRNTAGEPIATCTGSTLHGSITTATGTSVVITYGIVTWSGCSQTTTTVNTGSVEVMQVGTEDRAEVVGKGTNVTLNVFGVSCVYGTGEGTKLGTITGGEAAELSINAALARTSGGFLCPSTAILTANYIVTVPHAWHVVQ